MKEQAPKDGDLKVWRMPNLQQAQKGFEFPVASIEEAKSVMNILAKYDLFLGDLVQSNVQGLLIYNAESGGWDDWEDEEGNGIDDQE